jgi:hypothetical protein
VRGGLERKEVMVIVISPAGGGIRITTGGDEMPLVLRDPLLLRDPLTDDDIQKILFRLIEDKEGMSETERLVDGFVLFKEQADAVRAYLTNAVAALSARDQTK